MSSQMRCASVLLRIFSMDHGIFEHGYYWYSQTVQKKKKFAIGRQNIVKGFRVPVMMQSRFSNPQPPTVAGGKGLSRIA